MTPETFALVAAICLGVLAASGAVVAWVVARTAADARRLMSSLREEVPLTLRQARDTAASAEALTGQLALRVDRLDQLADEAEETLIALRATIAAADTIVRGPADVMDGAKRTAENVGKGLLSGADRIRRKIAGDDD